jgi:hypothetical protein
MSNNVFIRGLKYNKYALLVRQKKRVESNFKFFTCRIHNKVLVCIGFIRPNGCKNKYKVKIEYVAGNEPKTTMLEPYVEPCKEIHMYQDYSLCLHYPPDLPWNEKILIHEYTIPWLIEWIVYYELYLINGKIWEGRESPNHFSESERNVNKNID